MPQKPPNRVVYHLALLLYGLGILLPYGTIPGSCLGGDWPQILGPHRNGKAVGETLPDAFPKDGLSAAWTAKIGSGFAGPVVVGKKVIVFHRVEKQERVEAFEADKGASLWQTNYEARYSGGYNPDHGPRCPPLVHDGRIYVFGAAGDLHCLKLEDGAKVWTRELYVDYDGDEGYFGAGSTPILAGGKLLVNVGGRDDAGLVALNPASGKTVWKGTREAASYSAPTLAKVNGKEQAIFVTRLNCVAVDPQKNEARTLFAFGKSGPTVNAATPLILDGKVFVTASYGVGATLRSLDAPGSKVAWADDDTISSQYTTAVEHKGHLFGIHGRDDIPPAHLRCVEAATGKVKWSKDDFGVAHAILAGDKILLLGTTDGSLTLIAADPKEYRELGSARVADSETRALPAFSAGRLYFRTSRGERGELKCFVLGARSR